MKKFRLFPLLLCLLLLPLTVLAEEETTELPTTEEITEAPTEAPTEEPTEAPTEAPTEEPTEAPTDAPALPACGEYLTWHYDSGILVIAGTGDMYDYEKGQEPWSAYKNTLSTLILDGNVTYIGAYAFYDYDKLVEIDFGTALYEIGSYAFYDCDGLTELHMPASFKIFGERSFSGASNLAAIHCQGKFPKFKESCLWDVYCKIYFPVNSPWAVTNIADLEKAFKGRIEFLASDGSDPYTPTEETEPPTETPTQPTTAPATEPPTQPATEVIVPATTEGSTAPIATSTPPTEPEDTLPTPTDPTQPQEEKDSGSSVWIAIVILGAVLVLVNLGALIFRGKGSRRHKGKYHSR